MDIETNLPQLNRRSSRIYGYQCVVLRMVHAEPGKPPGLLDA